MFTMRNQGLRPCAGGFNLLPSIAAGASWVVDGAWEVRAEPQTAAKSLSCNWDNETLEQTLSKLHCFLLKKNTQKRGKNSVSQESMFSLSNTLPQSLEGLGVSFHVHLHHLASCDAQMLFGVTRSCPPIEDGL